MKTAITAMFLSFAATGQARSEPAFYRETERWMINHDAANGTCQAILKSADNGGLLFVKSKTQLLLSINSPKLSWLEKKAYPMQIVIDRRPFSGEMMGDPHPSGKGGSFYLVDPAEGFVDTIAAGGRLSMSTEGAQYGPFSLKGTREALNILRDCVVNGGGSAEIDEEPTEGSGQDPIIVGLGSMVKLDDASIAMPHGVGGEVDVTFERRNKADGEFDLVATLSRQGTVIGTTIMGGANHVDASIGYMQLDRDRLTKPHLVFTSFSGGTHCCTTLTAIDVSEANATVIPVGYYDTSVLVPKDVDGDGVYEFVVPDERFRVFGSYANTVPPIQVLQISDKAVTDVTRDERYAGFHRRNYAIQSEACGSLAKQHPGSCAGLAGTAAILGLLDETLDTIDFESISTEDTNDVFPICYDLACTKKATTDKLRPALEAALELWGFVNGKPEKDVKLARYLERFAGKHYADPSLSDDDETSCKYGGAHFDQRTMPNGSVMHSIAGYEEGCTFSRGVIFGDSMVATTVCSGEGSPPYLRHLLVSGDGKSLSKLDFIGEEFASAQPLEMTACPPQP
ncbi:hypothetical protein [Rhizobium giardinii]|uniref:hypothetical protein n=1 Tax=Rhizobium giardinii TaxID=56731 RepID=UPI003D6F4B0B